MKREEVSRTRIQSFAHVELTKKGHIILFQKAPVIATSWDYNHVVPSVQSSPLFSLSFFLCSKLDITILNDVI